MMLTTTSFFVRLSRAQTDDAGVNHFASRLDRESALADIVARARLHSAANGVCARIGGPKIRQTKSTVINPSAFRPLVGRHATRGRDGGRSYEHPP
jgi:hypothetical protein